MADGLIKFEKYEELKSVTKDHPQIVIVQMKDGSKYYLADPSQLAEYSNKPDVDSFMFFYEGDEGVDAGVQETKTVATVQVPAVEVKPPPKPPEAASLPMIVGAISGAISSMGTPALMNLAKSLLNSKSKKSKGEDEQPTDCKTHQVKANLRFNALSSRVSALESKPSMPELPVDLEELEERIERLEKFAKSQKRQSNSKK